MNGEVTICPGNNSNSMTVVTESNDSSHEVIQAEPNQDIDESSLRNEIINHVANSAARFKSQQQNDPELALDEKREIVSDIFDKGPSMFLARFGHYISENHLKYFEKTAGDDAEMTYHIKRLRRYHDEATRKVDVKNRRYEALKRLVDKGEYFSETEMMRRNPLLYEYLVGQYMTEEQKKARDNIDTTNITFVNLLLESIDRDGTKNLIKKQQDEEAEVTEERDSDSDDSMDSETSSMAEEANDERWGEMEWPNVACQNKRKHRNEECPAGIPDISSKELQVLRHEFVTNMYQNFLDGKDKDFDYSTIDDDESYDNVDLRTQDEEEKYFDAESPETVSQEKMDQEESSEDELDKYMRSLQEEPTPNQLAKQVEKQTLEQ